MEEEYFIGFEDNLETQYVNNELSRKLHQIEQELLVLESKAYRFKLDFRQKLQQALSLLNLHIQNYQRLIINRRRRSQQRLRRRQSNMRSCFMQILMDMQVQFLELLPLNLHPKVLKLKIKEQAELNLNRLDITDDSESPKDNLVFYEHIVSNFTEEQWLDTFHMSKKTFSLICNRLKSLIKTKDMALESFITMGIYALATGSTFRSVGLLFNKPQTYVRSALYEFANGLLEVFEKNFLSMPHKKRHISKICEGFARVSHLPPCAVGVLSIFELPTFAYARPGFKSYGMDRVIVQALIDDNLKFRKVEVSHQTPSLFLNTPNELTTATQRIFKQKTLTHFVVAPPHYPLRSWLMHKYDQPQEQYEHDFNQALQKINIFRDVALQRLFGRWQILSSSEFIEPESKSVVAKACCILHNLLEECDELYSEEWSDDVDLSKYEYREETPTVRKASSRGKKKRNIIAKLIQPLREKDERW